MSLKEVYCQDRAIGALQVAFAAGKLAHAYIFAGPDGVGRFLTARQWAKVLLCHNRIESKGPRPTLESPGASLFVDSCGECPSCQVFEGDGHPDFKHLYKELRQFTRNGKGKTTPVDMPKSVIDEFLIEKVASRPVMSDCAVYVVSEAEKLNNSSQNALLKVLEEPPKYCYIILLCSRLENLLPTTLSRCQTVRFGPVDQERIAARLMELGIGPKEATYWARFSEGSIGSAIAWAQLQLEGQSCFEIKMELVRRISELRLTDCVEFAVWIVAAVKQISAAWMASVPDTSKTDITRRVQKGLIRMIIAALSDAMRLKVAEDAGPECVIINSDQMSQISKLAAGLSVTELADRIDKAYENIRWVDASVNEKLLFEELLLNFAGSGMITA